MAKSKPRITFAYRDGQLVPIKMSYEGASTSRRMAGKGMITGGPNSLASASLPTLRSRSRHVIRNNAYASGARDSYVSNLIGTGIKPDWRNPEIQAVWDQWVEECDADELSSFYGLQDLAAGGQFEGGEVFGRMRFRRPGDGLVVPLQIQVLESEHLDAAHNVFNPRRPIQSGIEFDEIGRRRAYHFWRFHPSETSTRGMNTRVPVPADRVVHLYRRTRPGQLRGLPELTSVIVRLYEIDEMQDAVLARQKLAQLFGAFVKRKSVDAGEEFPDFGTQVLMPGEEDSLTEFTPGGIHYLEDDEEVVFSTPPDVGSSYTEWLRGELLAVFKGAGITYEQGTGDLKGVNYSSIRAGLLEFRRRAEALQAHLIVHQWCRPIAAKWLDVAVVSGAVSLANYWANRRQHLAIDWIAPKWAWVDPLKEVTADLLEVRAGFKPRSEAAAERGWDRESLDRAIEQDNQSADDRGLVLDSDPRKVNKSGALQAAVDILSEEEPEPEESQNG